MVLVFDIVVGVVVVVDDDDDDVDNIDYAVIVPDYVVAAAAAANDAVNIYYLENKCYTIWLSIRTFTSLRKERLTSEVVLYLDRSYNKGFTKKVEEVWAMCFNESTW